MKPNVVCALWNAAPEQNSRLFPGLITMTLLLKCMKQYAFLRLHMTVSPLLFLLCFVQKYWRSLGSCANIYILFVARVFIDCINV